MFFCPRLLATCVSTPVQALCDEITALEDAAIAAARAAREQQ